MEVADLSAHNNKSPLRLEALKAAVGTGLALAIFLLGLALSGAAAPSAAVALLGFLGAAALVIRRIGPTHPHAVFGAANRVTLCRVALTMALGGVVLSAALGHQDWGWLATGIAVSVLVLDGVDGALARRNGTASPFGARFDVEADALLMTTLSIGVLIEGVVGPWVLGFGAIYYAFVLASWAMPWLAAPLPPAIRRKSVFVIAVVALIVAVSPLAALLPVGPILALAGSMLLGSFAIDVVWLARNRTAAAT